MKRIHRERWREIPGYEGYYSVSSLGRVRRDKAYRCTSKGRILSSKSLRNGYPSVELYKRSVGKTFNVHALVALAFMGPTPEGEEIRHLDGHKLNFCLSNLAFGTHVENSADMILHGRTSVGEKHHDAVLKDADVLEMRRLFAIGYSSGYLAALYGVSRTAAWEAASGRTWKHLKGGK